MTIENESALIDKYFDEKIKGRYFSEIRKELFEKGMTESEVKLLIGKIDEKVLQYELSKTSAKINKQILYLGIVLLILGLALFILSRFGIYITKSYLIISLSLTCIGVTMTVYSLLFSNKPRRR